MRASPNPPLIQQLRKALPPQGAVRVPAVGQFALLGRKVERMRHLRVRPGEHIFMIGMLWVCNDLQEPLEPARSPNGTS